MRSMLESSCSIACGPRPRRAISIPFRQFTDVTCVMSRNELWPCRVGLLTTNLTITTTTTTTTLHLETWEMMAEVSQIVETSFETNQKQNRQTRQTRLALGGFSVHSPRYVLLKPPAPVPWLKLINAHVSASIARARCVMRAWKTIQ